MPAIPSMLAPLAEIAQADKAWVWLLRVQAQVNSQTPAVVFLFTTRAQTVTWPPSGPSAETYYPFPFAFDNIEVGSEGDLPQLDVVLDNSTRVLMDLAHSANGFEGAEAVLHLVHEDTLGDAGEVLTWSFEVESGDASGEGFVLHLAGQNFWQVQVPTDRFLRKRCRFQHGGEECGYVVNEVAAFQSCAKTPEACSAHGDDEVARQLPRLHPKRYGAFPGIATGRT